MYFEAKNKYKVNQKILEKLSTTKSPAPVIATISRPKAKTEDFLKFKKIEDSIYFGEDFSKISVCFSRTFSGDFIFSSRFSEISLCISEKFSVESELKFCDANPVGHKSKRKQQSAKTNLNL